MKVKESIVIPFYNEQDNVEYVLKDLVKEIIFVFFLKYLINIITIIGF